MYACIRVRAPHRSALSPAFSRGIAQRPFLVPPPPQLLSFPLSSSNQFPWHKSEIISLLSVVLGGFSMSFIRALANPALKLTLYFVAVVWVCSVLTCAVWVGMAFLKENFGIIWPVKVRRAGRSWLDVFFK